MKRKIHVVPHSHWDREWYFTTSRSKVYLMKDLKDVLDTLESNDKFKYFMVDAQGSLLDDYIKWKPHDKDRIMKLVQKKKLIIGPWYTQSDQLVISGESIVRNMYYGMKRCENFGGYMNVGYVPDSFGQSGNMPQIYRQFGIEDTLFWRGVSDEMVKHTDFNWRGDDGSVVFATQIPFGYYIGGNIPEDPKANNDFWQTECFKKAGGRSATRHIYFPNGFDQAPIRTNLPKLIEERNKVDPDNEYVISCVEDYIKDVKSEKPNLEEVNGELVIAKHMRIHKSIFSSRSDLKVLNTKIQNYVTNTLEPILTIAYNIGFDYPHEAVKEVWKLLFENAAHDSIGSCISDTANEDVYVRYKQARDISVNLVELYSRLIATNVKNKNGEMTLTIINPLPHKRNETAIVKAYLPGDHFAIKDPNGQLVNYSIIEKRDLTDYVLSQTIRLDPSFEFYVPNIVYEATIAIELNDIPAMGYTQYTISVEDNSLEPMVKENKLENEFYKISISNDGSLTILDKQNGCLYENQGVLVENGDDGDSFNYSPPRKDVEVFSTNFEPDVRISGSDIIHKADIAYNMVIPSDLEERAKGKCSIQMPVKIEVSLRKYSKVVDFKVTVDNKGLSHRLCVLFDSQMVTKFNFADQQFGSISRPNVYEKEMKSYLTGLNNKGLKTDKVVELANWANDQSSWQEPPISIEPTQSYVALANEERGIAVIPQGVREYEIVGKDKNLIRLTLFRTYGFMGKENLVYRPGRASGEKIIETPDAQLLKKMSFDFGFMTFVGNINNSNVDTIAKDYNSKIEVYNYAPYLNGRLIFSQREIKGTNPIQNSLFKTENRLIVSTIKKAEDNNGIIIRLFNGKNHCELNDTISFNTEVKEAYYTNLKEEKVEMIDVLNNTINVKTLGHCQFITICVKL
ncbi:MAG: mannosylglycerate hydrolase [Thomasclavelia sp.]|nr:mannosylglycerate hydrolase [Thomasclavelia sp.]